MSATTKVVLTAGFDKSLHVATLAELLRRDGVNVAGLLVVSPYSLKRLRALMRQRGRGFVKEAAWRLLGRAASTEGEAKLPLTTFREQQGIEVTSLQAWANHHRVRYASVKSINAPEAVAFIRSLAPEWVVYGGGGILHEAFIEAARGQILNAHQGPLPEIRGMNAPEWSLLLGYAPAVTVHLINRGIDTGGVLAQHPVPVKPGDTIEVLRSRCLTIGVEGLWQAVLAPPASLPRPASEAAGHRQCFVLAPALRELLARRLQKEAIMQAQCETSVFGEEGIER